MGYNTVAVLINDHIQEIRATNPRLAAAMQLYPGRTQIDTWFGTGSVISQDHADGNQLVIVGQNSGSRITRESDRRALERAADQLRMTGCSVKLPWESRASGYPNMKWEGEPEG